MVLCINEIVPSYVVIRLNLFFLFLTTFFMSSVVKSVRFQTVYSILTFDYTIEIYMNIESNLLVRKLTNKY